MVENISESWDNRLGEREGRGRERDTGGKREERKRRGGRRGEGRERKKRGRRE